jgi:3'-phosphoadenosine 5'-phosphosulfate sulfotransferase (PAPS reductase)/FAD synthetase
MIIYVNGKILVKYQLHNATEKIQLQPMRNWKNIQVAIYAQLRKYQLQPIRNQQNMSFNLYATEKILVGTRAQLKKYEFQLVCN